MPDFNFAVDRTAVVFIEYQKDFTNKGGKLYPATKAVIKENNMLENSTKLLQFCRGLKGITILHVPVVFDPGHKEISDSEVGILSNIKEDGSFGRDDSGSEYYEPMEPIEGEMIVKGKTGLCGFHTTNLDFLLRQKDIKNVILAGFLTNCCIESTMRTAYEKGYKVYTLKDCTAATSLAAHESAFQHNFGMFSIPTTSDEIIEAITASMSD